MRGGTCHICSEFSQANNEQTDCVIKEIITTKSNQLYEPWRFNPKTLCEKSHLTTCADREIFGPITSLITTMERDHFFIANGNHFTSEKYEFIDLGT